MDDGIQLTCRHTVRQVGADHTTRVLALVYLQTPRQSRWPAVKLLIEVIPQPADRLRQNDSRRDRVTERRQRYAATAAADPCADAAERDRTPDTEAAVPDSQRTQKPGTAVAEVLGPVGDDVVEPTAEQAERHRPQRNVVDDAALAASGFPPSIADDQGHHDADDDEQRIRPNRDRTEIPHALRRTRDVGEECGRHAVILCRTPSASSLVSVRTASTPSCNADTNADPTITPSA